MSKKTKDDRMPGLMIEYRELGTVSIEEMTHAIIEDLKALKEIYNVQYVKGARLRLPITNQYGELCNVRRPGGGNLYRIDTHHYRPACMDYEL